MDTLISEETKKRVIQNVIRILVAYNRLCIQIKIKYRCYRKQHSTFDLLCTFIDNAIAAIVAAFVYLTCDKIERPDPAWVSLCEYQSSFFTLFREQSQVQAYNAILSTGCVANGMKALTCDNYVSIVPPDLGNWSNDTNEVLDPSGRFYPIIHDAYLTAKKYNKYNIDDAIIIAKICPTASVIKLAKNADADPDLTELKTSSARFLEIEYKCGNHTLEFEVPKSHYFAGNELLSKAYVLRYLEHLPMYARWSFNESEYELRIVDEDSEVFSLTSKQYVRLEWDGYRIVDLSTPTPTQVEIEQEETKECNVEN